MRANPSKLSADRYGKKLATNAALHEQVRSRLRALIVGGQLAPGSSIVETELSESLGISRTPLREALKLLAMEGLVDLRSNRSSKISQLRSEEIEQLFEVMAGVEAMAARLAARRATPSDLRRLKQLQKRMERHHDRSELGDYFLVNQEVHRFVVACSKNNILIATHEGLFARGERARFFALSFRARWEDSIVEHRELLKALEERDSEAAERILAHHVRRTGNIVKGQIERSGGGPPGPDQSPPEKVIKAGGQVWRVDL